MEQNKQNQVLSLSSTDKISFNNIDISYNLRNKNKLLLWLNSVIENENQILGIIDYNFCSDEQLLKINKKYLNHNDYTDIITFDLSDNDKIFGDIYISIDRVKENAHQFKTKFHEEILRVMVHGVLHLCGYKDKTPKDKEIMRNKENHYLSLLN